MAPPDLEMIALASNPSSLLTNSLNNRTALLIVDAATIPNAVPGQLLDLDYHRINQSDLPLPNNFSSHGFGPESDLAMANALGWLPARVRLILANAQNRSIGSTISSAVAHTVPQAASAILRWLSFWRSAVPCSILQAKPPTPKENDYVGFKNCRRLDGQHF